MQTILSLPKGTYLKDCQTMRRKIVFSGTWCWQHHEVSYFQHLDLGDQSGLRESRMFQCPGISWRKPAPEWSGPQNGTKASLPTGRYLSIQPRNWGSVFKTTLWMSSSGPSRANTWIWSIICGEIRKWQTIPIQPDGVSQGSAKRNEWVFLQIGVPCLWHHTHKESSIQKAAMTAHTTDNTSTVFHSWACMYEVTSRFNSTLVLPSLWWRLPVIMISSFPYSFVPDFFFRSLYTARSTFKLPAWTPHSAYKWVVCFLWYSHCTF